MAIRSNDIEITERLMPAFFILFAVKLFAANVIIESPAYAYAAFLPETVWAIVFLVTGVLQLAATVANCRRLRCVMLFISASLWMLWAILIVCSHVPGFGEIIWTLTALQCFWTYHRLYHASVI